MWYKKNKTFLIQISPKFYYLRTNKWGVLVKSVYIEETNFYWTMSLMCNKQFRRWIIQPNWAKKALLDSFMHRVRAVLSFYQCISEQIKGEQQSLATWKAYMAISFRQAAKGVSFIKQCRQGWIRAAIHPSTQGWAYNSTSSRHQETNMSHVFYMLYCTHTCNISKITTYLVWHN